MKLIVTGYGRHGKDTVCEFLKDQFGLTFQSSSQFCADLFIYEKLKDIYNSSEECYADRHNNRALWYDLISEYNKEDPSKLGRELFKTYDVYCGLRNKREFISLMSSGIVDASIWVDRSKHYPAELSTSITITPDMCDYVLDNNSTLEQLEINTYTLVRKIIKSCSLV